MLVEYDIVVVKPGYRDQEVAGRRGHVIGMVEGDQIAVFVYDVERVWCVTVHDLMPTGERDTDAENSRGEALRVSRKGELLE